MSFTETSLTRWLHPLAFCLLALCYSYIFYLHGEGINIKGLIIFSTALSRSSVKKKKNLIFIICTVRKAQCLNWRPASPSLNDSGVCRTVRCFGSWFHNRAQEMRQRETEIEAVYFNPIRHLSPRGHIYNTSVDEQCRLEYKILTKVVVVCFQHLEKITLRTIFQKTYMQDNSETFSKHLTNLF